MPDVFEGGNDSGGNEVPLVTRDGFQDVEANRVLEVAAVKHHDIIGAVTWNVFQNFCGKVSVRVKQADTMTSINVGKNEAFEQCAFAGAGFANHIQVLPPIVLV